MSLADGKLDTMPAGQPASVLGVDSNGNPVLFSAFRILAQSSVPLTVPADATEDTMVSVTLPGGTLGPNGQLRVTTVWSSTSSGNSKTGRVKHNTGALGTFAWSASAGYRDQRFLGNRNSQSSQVLGPGGNAGGFAASSSAPATTAINTASDTTINITGQKASSGESLVLESYLIEVLYAP